jgi:hypothetical protein
MFRLHRIKRISIVIPIVFCVHAVYLFIYVAFRINNQQKQIYTSAVPKGQYISSNSYYSPFYAALWKDVSLLPHVHVYE